MGTQQGMRVEIESVMHGPRRMMGGDVERLEVVEIVLDLRPFDDRETDLGKQRLDTGPVSYTHLDVYKRQGSAGSTPGMKGSRRSLWVS